MGQPADLGAAASLFVRPVLPLVLFRRLLRCEQFPIGHLPVVRLPRSRYGYDPLYAYAAAQNVRTNPRWADECTSLPLPPRAPRGPPARTFAETRTLAARPAAGPTAGRAPSNLMLGRPLTSSPPRRRARRGRECIAVRAARRRTPPGVCSPGVPVAPLPRDRLRRELEARPANPPARAAHLPRQLELPRSPIVAAPRAEGPRIASPAMPQHPDFDRSLRPAAPGVAPFRHEPHPEIRPPPPAAAPAAAAAVPPARPGAPGPKRK